MGSDPHADADADADLDPGSDPGLDRRTYDLLRLIDANEPIGSIRLVDLMQRRGYSIKGRTIRLLLSRLDDAGVTTKVPGKGRRLTDEGRAELDRGDVTGRREQVRARIATLTSRVTYDPAEDAGEVVASTAYVAREDLPAAMDLLADLDRTDAGPVRVAADDGGGDAAEGRTVRLAFPSSITVDGVLLSRGIDVDLKTAGLVEYDPAGEGRSVRRYIDVLSGEGSTMDVVSLLIEAGRTDVTATLDGDVGVLIVDNREFPLTRFAEARDLAGETADRLGGVLDVRRPREPGPFPDGSPGWNFASLTYGGVGETALGLLYEASLLADWETLDGSIPAADLERVQVARADLGSPGEPAE